MRIAFAAAFGLLLSACSGAGGYPPEVKTNFMGSCMRGGNQALCDCAWDKITAQVPFADFMAIENAAKAGPAALQGGNNAQTMQKIIGIQMECAMASMGGMK